ncbi:hypothetical protein EOA60_09600 [Mesorhizobium sp. M1A.F.Ca.IN.020.06.1.1]|uniref:hypothetical protein n=1 Tax=unclassified Mesorhizobium TaxID=325217 RepID=UPI000FCB0C95|nr:MULTISPECIES: hypothetical protein [unclassified Mesorhizobium]RUV07986.1 hypothetical protein EOA79_02540 [Mesorhizobium sp. M1A.F.Ca.IN.020.03.2.1]RUV84323.1 hypothetical protein EOA51_22135 [Mesorhizobium sp. M1A.F.Ca.IN.020.32.1.1]RUW13860.1 hypothetical protein EOA46_05195 [Mesorhizobium sp. M1A.F.Ca.IN.022.05.2.1]RUW32383.1 hypothetical protein EOA60_09600 [Mesorhizobium sp. M1A.F.Ca.IN.020.06.1.1]RWF81323.1 MAG: hypothetical protein EOQ35_14280 [Mesorhizobium sp.]
MMKFRKGDLVSITARVKYDQNDEGVVWLIVGRGQDAMVKTSDITMVSPHFNVGDPVIHSNGATGFVRAVQDSHAWVELDDKTGFATWAAAELRLIGNEPASHEYERPSSRLVISGEEPEVVF